MAAPTQDPPVLLTPHHVSAILGIPTATLANWRYRRQGPPFIRVGRHVRYRPEALDAWLASLENAYQEQRGRLPT